MTAQQQLLDLAKSLQLPIIVDFHGDNKEIVQVTLNRPKELNCIPPDLHPKFNEFWTKYEELPAFRVLILTGAGKVFCAGADLKAWLESAAGSEPAPTTAILDCNGFLGLSNRSNKKPFIAALNGPSYGGGTEALINCELVVAVKHASITLPEVRVGVTAIAGALPRLGRLLSLQQASELALVGEPVPAATAKEWGLINRLVNNREELLATAVDLAKKIVLGSPEGIYVSQRGVRRGYEETKLTLSEATLEGAEKENTILVGSENQIEGLSAFSSRRKPKWKESKL